ncbi:hypothetical protein ACK8P5_22110 [Paenibacillus sp. EC2-1]|uniref:hypothetical protein n=1 Tax=Paenibacillus sp. EC2-1 TaxID=3388665 RepID=UPI003BEEEF49
MKRLWMGMTLTIVMVAVSWIGNVWYFKAQQLGEPLFLEHHIEMTAIAGDIFDLYYLEDLNGEKKVSSISIPDFPEIRITTQQPDYQRYSHQQLGRFIMSLPSDIAGLGMDDADTPKIIRTAFVQFNDGTSKEVDIGEIRLKKLFIDKDKSPVKWSSGGSSSDLAGFDTVQIERPVSLQGIKTNYLSLIKSGQLKLYIDTITESPGTTFQMNESEDGGILLEGVPFQELELPQKFHKGDAIHFSYKYIPEEISADIYSIHLEIEFMEEDQLWDHTIHIKFAPSFTEKAIRNLVRDRREANE